MHIFKFKFQFEREPKITTDKIYFSLIDWELYLESNSTRFRISYLLLSIRKILELFCWLLPQWTSLILWRGWDMKTIPSPTTIEPFFIKHLNASDGLFVENSNWSMFEYLLFTNFKLKKENYCFSDFCKYDYIHDALTVGLDNNWGEPL